MGIKELKNRIKEILNKEVKIYDKQNRLMITGYFYNIKYDTKSKTVKLYYNSFTGLLPIYIKASNIRKIELMNVKKLKSNNKIDGYNKNLKIFRNMKKR